MQVDISANHKVTTTEGKLWAESRGFLFYETSALANDNVTEVFEVPHPLN